ncbi:hypothetical protein GIB67_007642 [Kingdonia uniflora]|uniref:Laccase n=1 Tax=Kingdonia uniflora TaxID=39325 RepID=A0A7J7N1D1_9MAGN|nr:hypothetical protein GIB67_007642 [Kingdonia uniflora]
MARTIFMLSGIIIFFASIASAAVVEHTLVVNIASDYYFSFACYISQCHYRNRQYPNFISFQSQVENLTVRKLCDEQVIVAVNGSMPGPTLRLSEGDTLIVHVHNHSPYNMTIHWHGVFQLQSAWSDGPAYMTQCPILPGNSYTYNFTITTQEGTLWWHAHVSWLRATVYGALIIRPRPPRAYPFPKPHKEIPIILGEWFDGNVVDLENNALASGTGVPESSAYTINGRAGDLYPCSNESKHTFKFDVEQGKTYLLRIINAALNNQLFFKIARHNMTVVNIDAAYTNSYNTDMVVLAPGQTTDVLFTANQPKRDYYMAARPYASAPNVSFDNTTTRGIIHYRGANSSVPEMPVLPAFDDNLAAHKFYGDLTSLLSSPHWVNCPRTIDEHLFITIGLGLSECGGNSTCNNPFGSQFRFSANMNNLSFVLPSTLSMLEAFYSGVQGIYTEDFPSRPPLEFNYTDRSLAGSVPLMFTPKGTHVKRLRYNATVQIVMQNTALLTIENHPIHFHGHNFYVIGHGFGNYNETRDPKNFNLVNPQERNTIAVPVGGWAAIRFRANNPGVWFFHCHLDAHLPWGLGTAFVVENGPTPETSLPPPPPDLPRC